MRTTALIAILFFPHFVWAQTDSGYKSHHYTSGGFDSCTLPFETIRLSVDGTHAFVYCGSQAGLEKNWAFQWALYNSTDDKADTVVIHNDTVYNITHNDTFIRSNPANYIENNHTLWWAVVKAKWPLSQFLIKYGLTERAYEEPGVLQFKFDTVSTAFRKRETLIDYQNNYDSILFYNIKISYYYHATIIYNDTFNVPAITIDYQTEARDSNNISEIISRFNTNACDGIYSGTDYYPHKYCTRFYISENRRSFYLHTYIRLGDWVETFLIKDNRAKIDQDLVKEINAVGKIE